MIEWYLGKTGGGKSYAMVKSLINYLVNTDAYIVTNLPLVMGELNAYLQRKWPEKDVNAVGRVRLLSKAETRQFYLYRELGNDLSPVSKEQEKLLQFPDFEAAAVKSGKPCVYFIDEAHIYFDARAWADVGPTLNFFCSQHEKFFCHIVFCTQFLKQVELRLREHGQEFNECINHALRKILYWKQPKYFTILTTYKPPPCPADSTDRCFLDLEVCACYRSTGGVGIFGALAQRFAKPVKGMPIWTVPVFIVGAILVAIFLMRGLTWGATKAAKGLGGESAGKGKAIIEGAEEPKPQQGSPHPNRTVSASPAGQERVLTGILRYGSRFVLVWSDGTTTDQDQLKLGAVNVTAVRRSFAVIDGLTYVVQPNPKHATTTQGQVGTARVGIDPPSGVVHEVDPPEGGYLVNTALKQR